MTEYVYHVKVVKLITHLFKMPYLKDIDGTINKLKLINNEKILMIRQFIIDLSEYIVGLNHDQLLIQGERSDRTIIFDIQPYSYRYAEFKKSIGQPSDRVTLRLTGEYYNTFKVETDLVSFWIQDNDEGKGDALAQKYGSEILGLTPENLDKVKEWVNDLFKEAIDEILKR